MKLFKRGTALLLTLLLSLSLLTACGEKPAPAPETPAAPAEEPVTLRVAALKGPTTMGLVKLMSDSEGGDKAFGDYQFTIAASADELTPLLMKGELDMACVPANLAAVLSQKTEGKIVTLAVNTLGVLYVMEKGDTVQSMADLKGKTIVAAGKGSTPEYALRYLLTENGLDPDKDVTIDWKSEHAECVAALASGAATIALLPQPFVTVAGAKIPELRMALDLTQEWDALKNGSSLLTGVVVARREIAEKYPVATDLFLQGYGASVDWVNANVTDAAKLIGDYGIVDAAVAEKALPFCNIVCITGSEMKTALSGYLQVLFEQNPQSVGGAVPADDFYYGA
ncbi:MAG: PhnD/SsuA/transferrin family substrate-binding protein [Oscillospiraceae bacterium]